ncbi:hypothetical protein B0T17DRAFT_532828 [Bombardia bombarda]|uniref:AAA+ ATPase domain-containing protein n=1 Tax=Bombardia bombarda TaxID=252184 RepID=A0AA40C4U9_9PEZI|nr:hypothetical protein B0T17DRAFT_532828 [Bombardia bombarda]
MASPDAPSSELPTNHHLPSLPPPILIPIVPKSQNGVPEPDQLSSGLHAEASTDESMTRAAAYYARLNSLIDRLESRTLPSRVRPQRQRRHHDSSSDSEDSETGDESYIQCQGNQGRGFDGLSREVAPETPQPTQTLLPTVKECNWENFVNRFSGDGDLHAIEILVAGPQLARDVDEEVDRRRRAVPSGLSRIHGPPGTASSHRVHRTDANTRWIQRVRIRSEVLLSIFSRVTGHEWGTKPHTFLRPFQYLISSHHQLKEELAQMELQADQSPTNGLLELRCYIEFAEARLLPAYNRFQTMDSSTRTMIRFDDLWCLFRLGDLIYMPQPSLIAATKSYVNKAVAGGIPITQRSHKSWMHQKIFRVYGTVTPRVNPLPNARSRARFWARCYYLDFDGTSYGGVGWSFSIEHFEGEKDIRELSFYPLRFAQNSDKLLQDQQAQGSMFVQAVSEWHLSYDGWTYVTDPVGIPMAEENYLGDRRYMRKPQHVDGQVIVDFREAFNFDTNYKQEFLDLRPIKNRYSVANSSDSPHTIMTWADPKRSKLLSESSEAIVKYVDCEEKAQDQLLQRDSYLCQSTWPTEAPTGDDLALLPPRIFVYALGQRKFLPIDVRKVRSVTVQDNAFQQLELPAEQKRIIQAAVQTHLRRQRIERKIEAKNEELSTQDFILGKGRGLLIMLHGEPGVGKTATAEAVAQSTQRPLFPIACSDLEIEPQGTLERSLNEIFRLAHLWDCVLLMDEADVFLTSRGGYGSNLVSIFLRKLEYYNGILFLTTNRIGKIDPAMSSRIHLILHYKRQGAPEIEKIFRINIQRLRQAEQQQHAVSGEPPLFIMEPDILKFAADHCAKHPKGKGAWNGRQIRNAFSVAAALARYEAEQPGLAESGFQPQLRYSHFREVEQRTAEYSRFRAHVLGGDDSRKARLNEERDDDFEDEQMEPSRPDIASHLKQARMIYAVQQEGAGSAPQTSMGPSQASSPQPTRFGPPGGQALPQYPQWTFSQTPSNGSSWQNPNQMSDYLPQQQPQQQPQQPYQMNTMTQPNGTSVPPNTNQLHAQTHVQPPHVPQGGQTTYNGTAAQGQQPTGYHVDSGLEITTMGQNINALQTFAPQDYRTFPTSHP